MLRSFRFANHKSFRDEQELQLMPAYDKERLVVPVTGIYGANASGKTNLLNALGFMCHAVQFSLAQWEPGEPIPRHPFDDGDAELEPSWYVAEIVIDNVPYTYGFVLDNERILEEWLHSYPNNRRRVLFERSGDEVKFGEHLIGPKSELKPLLPRTALLLNVAARFEAEPALTVYKWLRDKINFVETGDPAEGFRSGSLVREFQADSQRFDRLRRVVAIADLGIHDVGIINTPVGPEMIFVHKVNEKMVRRTFRRESAGTLQWVRTLWQMLGALDTGSLLVVDEFETSLHPLLVVRLVELIKSEEEINQNEARLLFTTHDTTLLGTAISNEPLDRDEIWFVDKGDQGKSRLYALTDFHPRKKGENIERRYLGGSYDAVPTVTETAVVYAASSRN